MSFKPCLCHLQSIYRDEINSLQMQLSRTQTGPARAVKEQQEQNSPNHVQRINLISVVRYAEGEELADIHLLHCVRRSHYSEYRLLDTRLLVGSIIIDAFKGDRSFK